MEKTVEKTAEGCVIERFAVASPTMGREIKVVVVLPPGYENETGRVYPILHTLHGYSAPYDTFSQMEPLRDSLGARPMIVTCLDGDRGSFYVDSPICPDSQFNTFFFEEFIPYLDEQYRVDAMRRGVTGFSMGGYGAFQYMTTRPDVFNSVSSLSGAFYHLDDPEMMKRGRFGDILGKFETHRENYDANDPYHRVEAVLEGGGKLPPMFLHCGLADSLLDVNRDMKQFLEKRGCDLKYLETEGGHDWPFWRDASAGVIEFHWGKFYPDGNE